MTIKTRYAPSPTGYFHIGGARTAVINYLFAQHHHGEFIFRLDDTDQARNLQEYSDSQWNELLWLGLIPNVGVTRQQTLAAEYHQSNRTTIYQQHLEQLIKAKKAYYCFCGKTQPHVKTAKFSTPINQCQQKCEQLLEEQINHFFASKTTYVVRLKVEQAKLISWNDLIFGPMEFKANLIEDFILQRSDKSFIYNFCTVVDDHLFEISHVLRGQEHLSNTPRQLLIYQAFAWQPPVFAHLSLIVDENMKKLSKRNKDIMQLISEYRILGYLPQAIVNFLALLGWTSIDNQEFFSLPELITAFDEKRLSRAPAQFDLKKLNWLNKLHLRALIKETYLKLATPFLNKYFPTAKAKYTEVEMITILLAQQQEITLFSDLKQKTAIFFLIPDGKTIANNRQQMETLTPNWAVIARFLVQQLSQLTAWNALTLKTAFEETKQKFNLDSKTLFFLIRILTTHQPHGPALFETLVLFGAKNTILNIQTY